MLAAAAAACNLLLDTCRYWLAEQSPFGLFADIRMYVVPTCVHRVLYCSAFAHIVRMFVCVRYSIPQDK